MTEAERSAWLERRRSGVTSTDMAALMAYASNDPDMTSYGNIHDIWRDKVMGYPEKEIDSVRFDCGHALEPVAARRYENETGHTLVPAGDFGELPFRHPVHDILLATPDYFVVDKDGTILRIVECKTANARLAHLWGSPWTDDIPLGYVVQGHHQIVVGDPVKKQPLQICDYSAILGNDVHKCFQIVHSQELEDHCLATAERFWNDFVLTKTPPPPDSSEASADLRKYLWPTAGGETMQGDDELAFIVREYDKQRAAEKLAVKMKREAGAAIQDKMETASILLTEGFRTTWKNDRDSEKLSLEKLQEILKARGLESLIAEATVPTKGSRRFLVKALKEKVNGNN